MKLILMSVQTLLMAPAASWAMKAPVRMMTDFILMVLRLMVSLVSLQFWWRRDRDILVVRGFRGLY